MNLQRSNSGPWWAAQFRAFPTLLLCAVLVWGAAALRAAASGIQESFRSPDDAVNALIAAAKAKDTNALHQIFGPIGQGMVSPDVVQAAEERSIFLRRVTEKVQLVPDASGRVELRLGEDGWPFPIPLVQRNGLWVFDTEAGEQEILNRRIGRNELNAIAVCQAYVDAQREYASQDRNNDGVLEFASRLRSSPGTHDGLYWPVEPGEGLSPLGPLVAQARVEGYRHQTRILADPQSPYRGYYFKILTRQGRHAPGGKYNYIINGHMIAGFALVAWPAQWGNSGIMTFMVNQQGRVYQKNLGPNTSHIAERMTSFDPESTWKPAQ
jgi:hypothetical protein